MIGRQSIILVLEIFIGIIILIIAVASFLLNEDTGPMSYNELISDVEDVGNVSSLKSYKSGDIIQLKDTVDDILYFRIANNKYKIIILEGFKNSKFQLCFTGNQNLDCNIGDQCSFEVHVKEYNVSGQQVYWLEEWHNFYDIFFGMNLFLYVDFDNDVKEIIDDLSESTKSEEIDISKSRLTIDEVIGYTDPEKRKIEYLAFTVRPRAGTNNFNLTNSKINISINQTYSSFKLNENLITTLNKSSATVLFNTPIGENAQYPIINNLSENEFGIITINDEDESVFKNYTVSTKDRIYLITSLDYLNSRTQGLIPLTNVNFFIDYGAEAGKKLEVVSPDSYTLRLVKLI